LEETGWLRRLRRPAGLRDALEHDPVEVYVALVARRASGGVQQSLEAVMSHGPADELVEALREICRGLCRFLAGICGLVGDATFYRNDDELIVEGREELVTAFWPEI
jgi:hypothetical protein